MTELQSTGNTFVSPGRLQRDPGFIRIEIWCIGVWGPQGVFVCLGEGGAGQGIPNEIGEK